MRTTEELEVEIESLKKDNLEIRQRLSFLEKNNKEYFRERKSNIVEYGAENQNRTAGNISSKNQSQEKVGLTKQGSWIMIVFGFLLCLTIAGIIFGLPLLLWGLFSLLKSSKNESLEIKSTLNEEADSFIKEKDLKLGGQSIAKNIEIKNKDASQLVVPVDDGDSFNFTKTEEVSPNSSKLKLQTEPEESSGGVFSFEEEIGMKWFSRIGILALVVGVGFFIKYSIDMNWINHFARIIMGVTFGISLVIYGEIVSKKENYVKWAKTLVGGGIAITYFSVYAAYHFETYRQAIGISQFLDLILMGVVVLLAVVLSLKDNSQIIAAESFFLGYVTSLLNNNFELASLFYTLFLTVGLVAVVSYKKWPVIGLGGVIASYFMYALWNNSNQEQLFYASFILVFYFLAFALQSFFFSKKEELEVDNVLITLINSAFFFVLFYTKLKMFYPDYCSLFTLILGIFCLVSFIFYRKTNVLKLANTYLYLALFFFTLTVPIYFNKELITVVWAMETVVLAMLYLKTKNSALRIFLNILTFFVIFKSIAYDLVELNGINFDDFMQSTRLISIGATVLCFYLIYGIFQKNINLFQNLKSVSLSLYSWAASILLVLIIFVELGRNFPAWTTVILAFLLGFFMFIGKNLEKRDFYYQANILAGIVFLKVLFFDSLKLGALDTNNLMLSARIWTFGFVILIFYLICAYLKKVSLEKDLVKNIYSWLASILLVLIIFIEIGDRFPAWTTVLLTLVLSIFMLIGGKAKNREFYYQANLVALIILFKLLFHDILNLSPFDAENIWNSVRLGVFLLVGGVFYGIYAHLWRIAKLENKENFLVNVYAWMAFSIILLIIFVEFGEDYLARVSIGLGLMMSIYFLISKLNIKELFQQAFVVSQVLFIKVLFFDTAMLSQLKNSPSFIDSRFVSLLSTILFFYAISAYLNIYKNKLEKRDNFLTNIYNYYGTFFAFLLILLELKDYWISVGWSVLALSLILVGFVLRRKSLRIQGILIFAISIFKVFIYDIQGLEVIYRTISYITLGAILLTVSFIYNKHKEKLKEII